MNLIVGDQVSNGITTYTILKVNTNERYYHVITHYLTAKLKFDTVDDRYMYCGHIDNLNHYLDLISDFNVVTTYNSEYNKPMTVLDLLNKTSLCNEDLIEIFCPSCGFQVLVGCGNRNATLYKKFINTYGDMIVDEITIRETDKHIIFSIKVDYCDD